MPRISVFSLFSHACRRSALSPLHPPEASHLESRCSSTAICAVSSICSAICSAATAEAIAAGEGDRGVLLCGTGIGMSLAANKVKGAYAALISDVYSAQRAVLSNNANIACIGAFTVGEKLAVELLKTWLSAEFDPNCASAPKVARYKSYDEARGA